MSDLFDFPDTHQNLLPYDGEVYYYGKLLSEKQSFDAFRLLQDKIEWQPDEFYMFGKHIVTSRKVAWYGDKQFTYTYSGSTKKAHLWFHELIQLRDLVKQKTGLTFNSVLLNLYEDGSQGLGWHTDAEHELGPQPKIASLSLGATRRFLFRHIRSRTKLDLQLDSGSLLLMKGETQKHWQHALPKTKKVLGPRINLTFRQFRK